MWPSSLLLLPAALSLIEAAKFPNQWRKCPKIGGEDCLKAAVQMALDQLQNGHKALGVPPLNPLHLDRMQVSQGGSSPVSINLTLYNFDIIYNGKLQTTSAKMDWERYKGELELHVPGSSYLVGDYSILGKILVLPIRGTGTTNFTFEDMNIRFEFKGSEKVRKGRRYLEVDQALWIMDPKRIYLWFENLFDGVPGLGENMNKFLNENWRLLLEELRGSIGEAMGEAHRQIANLIFSKVPLESLYYADSPPPLVTV